MSHVVLLGDSIFDNQAYVGGEPDVISHLSQMLPTDWQATLKAVDGSVIANVSRQLREIPDEATHLVISGGGNDAILNADVLEMRVNSSAEFLSILANRAGDFEYHYRKMLKDVLSRELPTMVCTIYYPNFSNSFIQKIAVAALSVFNDAIIRQAASFGIPLLDLRLVCNEKSDYANEIEPSSAGGRKIAAKILEVVRNHDFSVCKTSIYF
jgi:hypothetical protein